ncbi:hypothetical protein Glove_476g77 [Diversispora epigaea]|uniref:Uncharacterized protein n=1 Tax=Diversispora epigaea TaxID=1348612 RepID=A0A397GKN9_9GLOM|nr:hypothetical protein Glove_476g77 [Diversispora epigaea]
MKSQTTLIKRNYESTLKICCYGSLAIEDWTLAKMTEYYREKTGLQDTKKIKDHIKKDLWKVINSEADFDATRKEKAKEVLDNWKLNLNSDEVQAGIIFSGDELFVRR